MWQTMNGDRKMEIKLPWIEVALACLVSVGCSSSAHRLVSNSSVGVNPVDSRSLGFTHDALIDSAGNPAIAWQAAAFAARIPNEQFAFSALPAAQILVFAPNQFNISDEFSQSHDAQVSYTESVPSGPEFPESSRQVGPWAGGGFQQDLEGRIRELRDAELRGDSEIARVGYEALLRMGVANALVYHRLAVFAEIAKNHMLAQQLFSSALQLDPGNPELLCDTGYHLELNGDIEGAIQFYRRAIEADRDHSRAHNHLGMALAKSNRVREAKSHFRKAGLGNAEIQQNLESLEH